MNLSLEPDSCVVYTKTYQNTPASILRHRLYVSPMYQLIVRHEVIDNLGNVIATEEIIGILY